MEPEGSIQCPHKSTTEFYLEPDESSPQSHTYSLNSILILSSHPCLGLRSGLPFSPSNYKFVGYVVVVVVVIIIII
jgi:hypothetical protein